ncbi:MAG: zinc-binding dehydrogenase [Oceanobacter sp.]
MTQTKSVRAMVMASTGDPDVLKESMVELPAMGGADVHLKVLAAGFNPIDTKIRSGLAPIAPESGILGCDVCGEVLAIGDDVADLTVGDRVFGFIGGAKHLSGALAEEVVVSRNLITLAPTSWTPEQVAILPVTGITAVESLERLNLDGQKALLILGASGGVGQFAVQIAAAKGLKVTGTAGTPARCEKVKALGATEALLHSELTSLSADGQGFDRVFDTFGGESLARALELASPYGQIVTINARGQHELSAAHAKSLTLSAIFIIIPLLTAGMSNKGHIECLNSLAAMIDAGKIAAPEIEVLPATRVGEVHRRYEAGELKNRVAFVWS